MKKMDNGMFPNQTNYSKQHRNFGSIIADPNLLSQHSYGHISDQMSFIEMSFKYSKEMRFNFMIVIV